MVEFRDDGYAVDRKQVAAALQHIDTMRERTRGKRALLVLTYTHGWHNGADTGRTGDFAEFRSLVHRMRTDTTMSPAVGGDSPVIVPIYLAWRGSSLRIPLVKYATFWSRKGAAERVGRGEFAGFIAEVAERRLRWQVEDSVSQPALVVHAGHSFGGAALLSATLPLLASSIAARSEYQPQPADLVVALNPAIEAAVLGQTVLSPIVAEVDADKARVFLATRAAKRAMALAMGVRDPHAPTRLAIIDAQSDLPRQALFPLGQGLGKGVSGALLDGGMIAALAIPSHAITRALALVPAARLVNRLPLAPMEDDERTAAGRYEPQVRLAASVASRAPAGARCWSTSLVGDRTLTLSPRTVSDSLACERSVKVIRVPDGIIHGHSDIWRPESVALIAQLVRGSLEAAYVQLRVRSP